jgi:glycosyltransferase involved in cell wall biosynthesis
MPFFSIILPCYNREKRILRAIESVLKQNFTDFELIIIDDASTDGTLKIIQSVNDDRIKVIANKTNQERCVSRNTGIAEANGEYICFLDSDDYHLDNHLQELHDFVVKTGNKKGLYFVNSVNENESGEQSERKCPPFINYNSYAYFLKYTVNPQRWAVHREVFLTVQFDPEVTIAEDMDFTLRLLAGGFPVCHLNKVTTVYVAASDSFTHGDPNKAEKEHYFFSKIFSKPALKSKLPKKEVKRLLSMCHFHLAVKAAKQENRGQVWKHAVLSFFLFARGYNGKTNKILLVSCIYALPLVGRIVRSFISKVK